MYKCYAKATITNALLNYLVSMVNVDLKSSCYLTTFYEKVLG